MIIGIIGDKGAGKSTAADLLVRHHSFTRTRFAEPLKRMLIEMGCTVEEVDGSLKEEPCAALNGRTPRHAMQTLGTEWGREMISPTIWLDAWCRAVEGKSAIVVDDCRFPNEEALIRARGGAIVKIVRSSLGENTDRHASEAHTAGLKPDHIVRNDGGIERLHSALFRALKVDLLRFDHAA